MFVTGLEFLPVLSTNHNHTVSSVAEAAVLSISVDNHVCIHTLPYRSKSLFFVIKVIYYIVVRFNDSPFLNNLCKNNVMR